MSNTTFKFRVNQSLLAEFQSVCRQEGYDASKTMRTLISKFVEEKTGVSEQISNIISEEREHSTLETFTIGEMYCGPGGIGMGAKRARIRVNDREFGFRHAFAMDYDFDTCKTYEANIGLAEPECEVIHTDIRQYDISSLKPVDGFLYGFPCNDFSLVGETKGLDGTFGPLYKYGVEYIARNNPKFIFAENVSGISSANSGDAFKQILQELADAGDQGYRLTAHLYKFEDYGIPQARHRYIIIGLRNDLNLEFKVPKPSGVRKTVKEALEGTPIPSSASGQELTRQSAQVVERLKHIKPGENAWTADLPEHLKLNVKGAKMSMIYRRLDPDKPSYTITGSGGGGTHVYHWSEPRALTNRERARLQTFPDSFTFCGSKESVRKQIGMAVPVDGAQKILECVLKTFAGVEYESVPPSIDISQFVNGS